MPQKPRTFKTPSEAKKPAHFHRETQYDQDTGSLMSGVYDLEQDPSMALSAQGVDLAQRPGNFAYSYPQADDEIARALFMDPASLKERAERTEKWLASSNASNARVYHEVSIVQPTCSTDIIIT